MNSKVSPILPLLMIAIFGTFSRHALARPPEALRVLSAAKPNVRWSAATELRADFDCDGRSDEAFLGQTEDRVYVGIVRARQQKPDILDFGVSGGVQAAICELPAHLRIESLDYDPTDGVGKIDGFRRSKICKGVELSGGDCDNIHLFWNQKTGRFEWWRL